MLASSVFLETSIPNTPSITVLSFHLVSSARAPLRTTLYAGSTLTRVPRYRPICTAELGKRGLIYCTGSFAKGTQEAHRSPRSSAKCVYSPSNLQRTRGAELGLMTIEQAYRVQEINARYVEAIDDDRLEAWPDFFTEDGRYRITTAENVAQGLPLSLIYATSRAMLRDRVRALREANVYESQHYRHV